MKIAIRPLPIFFLAMAISASVCGQIPIINSVVPVSTYPTNKILITGSGFSTNPLQLQVWFDQVSGTVTASTDFSIEVTIPAQARLTNVQVTNLTSGLSAKADLKFVPYYSGTDFDQTKLAAPLSFGATSEIFDVCSCDLDGDGKPDLIGTKGGPNGIAVDLMIQRNTSTPGSLSFVGSTLGTGITMTNLACGDLNGDGKPELVVSRGGATRNEIFIYRNTSTPGTIQFAVTPPNPTTKVFLDAGHAAFRIVIRDLNLDGKPEIIVTDASIQASGLVYVFVNQSSGGTLTMNPTPVKLTITGSTTTYGLEVQDLDGDKKPEVIVNQFNGSNIFIYKNSSTPAAVSFSTIQTITVAGALSHMAMADFNEDGKLDVVATNAFDDKALLLLNTTSGSTISFGTPLPLDTGDGPFGIDVSDVDGDGDVDMLVGNIDLDPTTPDTHVTVLRSNGVNNGLAFTTLNINVGKKSRNVRAGDLDGDGKPDFAFTTVNGNSLEVLRNTNCFVPQILNQAPATICAGQTIRLTTVPGIGVTTFEWKESGNLASSGTDAFFDITQGVNYTAPGNYTVTATSESGACITTSTIFNVAESGASNVPVTDPPTTVNANTPVCTGNALNLTTPFSAAGVSYSWTGPAGFTSTQQNPTINPTTAAHAGIYTLRLTDGTCTSAPVTKQVDVADMGAFTVSSSVPSNLICQGGNLTLSVNSVAGHTYQWIRDGGDIVGQTNPLSLVVSQAGIYKVRVTNTLLSCSIETSTVEVKVVTMPVSSFTVNATACVNEVLTFTNTSTTDPLATPAYAWNFGDAGTSAVQSPTHAYATGSTFNPQLTVSYTGVTGCSNASSKSVVVTAAVQPVPVASPTSSCPGETVNLSVSGTFNLITWSTTTQGATATVTQPGTYTVNTVDANGCSATGQVIVGAKPVPALTISSDKGCPTCPTPTPAIALGETAQLSATGADTYLWTPPETLSNPAIANPVATPIASTTYTVTGTLTAGCSAQLTIDIQVGGGTLAVSIPNVFTPNGDTVNDFWVITGADLYPDCTLTLFDNAGRKVFEQRGYTNNWDGTYQGKAVPEGNYYYVFGGCGDAAPLTGSLLVAR